MAAAPSRCFSGTEVGRGELRGRHGTGGEVHTRSFAGIEHVYVAGHRVAAAQAHVRPPPHPAGRVTQANIGSRTQQGPVPGEYPEGQTPASLGNTHAPPEMTVRTQA